MQNKSSAYVTKIDAIQKENKKNSVSKEGKNTAIALSYDPEEVAPKIVATGRGYVAEKIISAGKAHDVPIHQDRQLANTMSKLEVGDFIPKELYGVVSEILVFVDKMDNIKKKLKL